MNKFLALVLIPLCTGCSAVFTHEPLGSEPVDLSADAASWEGTWMSQDGAVLAHVADASNGLVKIAWDETHQGQIEHKTADLFLRNFCSNLYVSTAADTDVAPGDFAWARIQRDNRVVVVWTPDVPKFRDLVLKGDLPGETNGENVILKPLDAKNLEFICGHERELLQWDHPMVFWKVAD